MHRMLVIIVRPFLCEKSFKNYLKNSLAIRTKSNLIINSVKKKKYDIDFIYYLNHHFYILKNFFFVNGDDFFYEKLKEQLDRLNLSSELLKKEIESESFFEVLQIIEFFGYEEVFKLICSQRLARDPAKQFYALAYYMYLSKCKQKNFDIIDDNFNEFLNDFETLLKINRNGQNHSEKIPISLWTIFDKYIKI
ncbi:hypothetical protein GVAV_002007 [Gurleya vavrai]